MRLFKVSGTSLIGIFLACPLLAVHADDRDSQRDSIVTIELPRPGFATNALTLQVLVRYRLEEHRRSSGDSHHRSLTLELWLEDALVGAYALPNDTDAGDHSFDVDVSKHPDARVHLQADVVVNEKDEDSDEHRESRELRSRKIRVILDKTPPVLTLQSPLIDELFSGPSAFVQGTVTDNLSGVGSLSVNGLSTAIKDGAFQSTIPLPFSATALTVTATDQAGNIATIQRARRSLCAF